MRWADFVSERAFFPLLIFAVAPVAFILAALWGRYTYKGISAFAFMWASLFWVCSIVTGHVAFAWFMSGGVVALLVVGIHSLISLNAEESWIRELLIVSAMNALGIWIGFTAIAVSALYLLPDRAWLWLLVVLLMLCQIPICTKASISPQWYAQLQR